MSKTTLVVYWVNINKIKIKTMVHKLPIMY